MNVKDIEGYLLLLENTEGKAANMPVLEKVSDFNNRVKQTEYWRYIHSADYHYFVARVLFSRMVFEYAYFSGFQCIENYLKAYLKYSGKNVPLIHLLSKLLQDCRHASKKPVEFTRNRYIGLIIRRFEPYYEVGRYPVQKTKPKDGTQSFLYPTDIFVLDYFVYQMRQILSVPDNTWDLFREGKGGGHYKLLMCIREFPEFYNLLKWNNVNFPASLTEAVDRKGDT